MNTLNTLKETIKRIGKQIIVTIIAVILVLIGLIASAFLKAKTATIKALRSILQWITASCFPWLTKARYNASYAFSVAWRWIKRRLPSWRELRAPIVVALVVLMIVYVPGLFVPTPTPTTRVGSQSLHIGPQCDLSGVGADCELSSDILGGSGVSYFVSTTGNDANDCLSWDTACATIQHVIDNRVMDGNGDAVYIGAGLYDTGSEITVDKTLVSIIGVDPSVSINNTDTTNGSSVFRVTAGNVLFRNFAVFKNELVSLNSYGIYLDNVGTIFLDDLLIAVPPVPGGPHTGILVDSGDGIVINDVLISGVAVPFGTGIVFSDTVRSGVQGKSTIGRLGTGILFTGGTDEVDIKSSVDIFSCTTCVQLNNGVTSNTVNASLSDCSTETQDDSGNATNTMRGSVTSLRTATEHSGVMFPGTFIVVDGDNGLDTNSGLSPDEAVATIGYALTLADPGDGIVIRADGVYTETLVIEDNAIQIFAAQGVIINSTNPISPAITVRADNVWIREPLEIRSKGPGICVEGDGARIENVTVTSSTTGFVADGPNMVMDRPVATGYTVAGFDLSGVDMIIRDSHAGGAGLATTGYVISSTVSGGLFSNMSTIQNVTAGFSVTLGANDNLFLNCTSGTGDGDRVDANLTNMWSGYVDTQSRWRHEHNWPGHAGQGVPADPIVVDNDATDDTPDSRDDLNFWGDTVALINPSDIGVSWRALGLEIIAGTANKNAEWQVFYPTPSASSARNGGNAWDLGETVLTVDGSFTFVVGDTVWITSDSDPDGEIMLVTNIAGNVITVASETRASGNTGLRYDHAGNERMYLAERSGNEAWHATEGIYAAASAKDFDTIYFAFARENQASSGAIMRLLNSSDAGVFTISAKMKYEATKEHD